MASPVAHSFAGFWVFLLLTARSKIRLNTAWCQYLPVLCVLVLLANLPDFDVLLEFVARRDLHRGFSHSLAAASFVAIGLSCVWRIAGSFWRSATLYFLAYSSHLLIDLFTGTKLGWNATAYGIPLFWPWGKEFRSPLVLVVGVKHKDLARLFSMENVQSSIYELLIFGLVTAALLALWVRHQKTRATSHDRETRRLSHSAGNQVARED